MKNLIIACASLMALSAYADAGGLGIRARLGVGGGCASGLCQQAFAAPVYQSAVQVQQVREVRTVVREFQQFQQPVYAAPLRLQQNLNYGYSAGVRGLNVGVGGCGYGGGVSVRAPFVRLRIR